jgi:TIR domain
MGQIKERDLRIFVSHKMPSDTPMAQEIGDKLALYGGNRVKVMHAGNFRYGENWRKRIQEELEKSDWLILLFTESNEDWAFCLWECGCWFGRTLSVGDGDSRLLITLCKNEDQVSDALREFNAVVATEDAVAKLLKQIYHNAPWAINPNLKDETLNNTAREIVDIFLAGPREAVNYDIAPKITFEFKRDANPDNSSSVDILRRL